MLLKPALFEQGEKRRPLAEAFFSSLAATLFTLPVQLWFFYEAPLYAVFLNLLVIPLAGAVLGMGLGSLFVHFLFPPATVLFSFPVELILSLYRFGAELVRRLPYSLWTPGKPSAWQLCVYALLAGVVLFCKDLRLRFKLGLLCGAVMVFGISGQAGLKVTFLDVGQGDCICASLPDGSSWLFDGGSSSEGAVGKHRIVPFLKGEGISFLDAVFLSHADGDHMNGITELLSEKSISVGLLGLPCTAKSEEGFAEILKLAKERHIPVLWLEKGMKWERGGVSLLCLHPASDFPAEETNGASTVFYLRYGTFSTLLTGDVEKAGETALLESLAENQITGLSLLKVAHHGSANATGEALLEQLSPSAAVISYGRGNRYGHPNEAVLERLSHFGIRVYKTAESGAVTVWTDGKRRKVEAFKK